MNHSKNKGFTPLQDDRNLVTGFTLLEMVIVIAIMGILLSIALVVYVRALDQQALSNSVEQVISMIQRARSLSLSLKKNVEGVTACSYGVKISQPKDLAIFYLKADCTSNNWLHQQTFETQTLPAGVDISIVDLPPLSDCISGDPCYNSIFIRSVFGDVDTGKRDGLFYPLDSPNGGTVEVRSSRLNLSKIIRIFPTGVVQVE